MKHSIHGKYNDVYMSKINKSFEIKVSEGKKEMMGANVRIEVEQRQPSSMVTVYFPSFQ